ncbi:MAG: PRC-barrel domain-containing protein [Pseudomonadota bacterium]
MKTFYAAALAASLVAGPIPGLAQTATETDPAALAAFEPNRAAAHIGQRAMVQTPQGLAPAGWVSDVLINVNSETIAVLVETDAMVGAPSKLVAIDPAALAVAEVANEEAIVIQGAQIDDILAAAPFDDGAAIDDGLVRLSQVQLDTDAAGENATVAETATTEETATEAPEQPQAMVALAPEEITPEALDQAEVVDVEAESLGEVREVVTSADGAVEGVVVSVGGFLGFGAKSVAVRMEEVQVMRDPADGHTIVQVAAPEAALRERPKYEG